MTTMDKYDRQNRTYGSDATIKLNQSSVIVIGLSGIANETCKNLILSGILLIFSRKLFQKAVFRYKIDQS